MYRQEKRAWTIIIIIFMCNKFTNDLCVRCVVHARRRERESERDVDMRREHKQLYYYFHVQQIYQRFVCVVCCPCTDKRRENEQLLLLFSCATHLPTICVCFVLSMYKRERERDIDKKRVNNYYYFHVPQIHQRLCVCVVLSMYKRERERKRCRQEKRERTIIIIIIIIISIFDFFFMCFTFMQTIYI